MTFLTSYEHLEFENLIADCVARTVRSEISRLHTTPQPERSILTRQETAELLNISLPTLHDYTKRGLIKAFRLGYKVRYRSADVHDSLLQIKTK